MNLWIALLAWTYCVLCWGFALAWLPLNTDMTRRHPFWLVFLLFPIFIVVAALMSIQEWITEKTS
jgi:hypothetical protein